MDCVTKNVDFMLELFPTTRRSIDSGDFPLNHDCILKVIYIHDSPLRFQYFSCRSHQSGALVDIISKLSLVSSVKVSSVDDLPDHF